ncbi:endonuclease NucS domain-containing protein [Streptomyces aureoversilis]|uniref:endonuclease NucS domain-containing protein n=1 Tax=Streptomyces aureoversilis TaxID=67277 RepID=UPI0036D2BD5E
MSGGLRLFSIGDEGVAEITARGAVRERHLQDLVEANMEALLGVRFLASEYSTGARHRGRIDSLGLDENGAPVIVEYKRERGANVISQGLFYLSWLVDHRGEFQLPGPRAPREGGRFPGAVVRSAGDLHRGELHPLRPPRRP